MEQKYYWIISITVILGIVFIIGYIQQIPTSCEKLAKNFDDKIDSINASECDEWITEGKKPIWVGGKLIEVSKRYNAAYDRNEFILTFQGLQNQGKIHIGTKNESIPYETGKFYKFDLGNKCKLIYSMASSGMFSDPKLDALEHLPECD